MENLANNLSVMFEKIIGFFQGTGMYLMGLLALMGLLLFLLSGNSAIMKRVGIVMAIAFGFGIFVVSYVPVLFYYYMSDERKKYLAAEIYTDSLTTITGLFDTIFDLALPLVVTCVIIGLMIRGLGATNPMKKRKGEGLILISPLILLLVYVMPTILEFV